MKKSNLIYSYLLSAIFTENNLHGEEKEKEFLESLQYYVAQLRKSYRSNHVKVDYQDKKTQLAYLLAYYPGYIQQSYDTIISHNIRESLSITSECEAIEVSMFGCGPCPELVAIVSFISENFTHVKQITANVFDIAANTWQYSIKLCCDHVIPNIWEGKTIVKLHPPIDLRKNNNFSQIQCLRNSKIITFQNCINEIATEHNQTQDFFINNVDSIASNICLGSALILSDLVLYNSVSNVFQKIESRINNKKESFIFNRIKQFDTKLSQIIIPLKVKQYTLIGNKNGSTQIDKDLTPRSTIRYSSLAIIGNKKYIHSDNEYINFVLSLLRCAQGKERQLLQSKPELVNENLVKIMWSMAQQFQTNAEL